ncbi:FAD-dependent oxidoreductase / NADH oxidase [[Mycoplasma] cavipharyngis]|uniref:FAD-dependent oxidoreductase n=1 Tax=[Mycoplasma] cavipharyngis TaxID=92757 RepID=UPI003703A742
MKKKIVVVGINHAGTSAIKTLLIENPNLEIVGFEKGETSSFLGCGIALAVGGIVDNVKSLFYSSPEQLSQMGAKIHTKHFVHEINYQEKYVLVENLTTKSTFKESFDVLIYAGGSWPLIMPFHKPEYKSVKLCKTYEQALELIEDAKKNNLKNIAILGAGYIGVELTEAFAKLGNKNVTLIDMENRIMPRYFDVEFTDQVEASMKASGVNLLMSHKVNQLVTDNDNRVIALKAECTQTQKIEEVPVDLLISCVGFAPKTEILLKTLPNLKTSRNKAIAINEYAQALDQNNQPVPGLYIIGDSAATYYIPTNSHENVALATNAVKLGIAAASHINSDVSAELKKVKVDSITGTNAISVFGYSYASTGLSFEATKRLKIDADSAFHHGNDRCEFVNEYSDVKVKLVWEKATKKLIGAQIGSSKDHPHTETIFVLSLAIQKSMTLYDLLTLDYYFLPHLNKPLNFILCAVVKALGLAFNDHCYLCS